VLQVICTAYSLCVKDDRVVAEADVPHAITAVRGITHAVVKEVHGIIRTTRSPRVDDYHSEADHVCIARSPRVDDNNSGVDLVHAACSPRIDDLVRTALGEVWVARARPVQLRDKRVPLHVSSL
jgi:hypothetical protein